MTVTTTRQILDMPSRAVFGAAIHAEWVKFRTIRGWLVGLVIAAAMLVTFTFLVANGSHSGTCTGVGDCTAGHPLVPTGPDGEAVADTYQYLAVPLAGDGTFTAAVTSLSGRTWAGPLNEAPSLAHTRPGLGGWTKAGILLTPGTNQGAPYAAVMVTGNHGNRFQYNYTHDRAGLAGTVTRASPHWVRLTRIGSTITGYDSTDGTAWTRIGATRFGGLPTTVDVGLFVTSPVSHQGAATQATARFDHITLAGHTTSNHWQHRSIGTSPRDFYPTLGTGGYRRSGNAVVLTGSGDLAPAIAGLTGSDTASSTLSFGIIVALLVLIVIATLFITVEYRRGLIRTSLSATPQRVCLLAAKALVIAAAAFVTGATAAAVAIPLGEHVLTANGNYIFPANGAALARIILGTGALLAAASVGVLAVGSILRRAAGGVTAGLIVFVLPALLGPVSGLGPGASGATAAWLYRITPAAGISVLGTLPRSTLVDYPYTLANHYYPLSPWAGLAVLCGFAAAALILAAFLLHRRDA